MAQAREGAAVLAGRRWPVQVVLLVLALLGVAWWQRPDGRLQLIFPALKGDAVLIQTPGGGWALVDGGADPTALAAALGRYLPFWQRRLDLVVLTAPDSGRLPGQVAALERYAPGMALAPGGAGGGAVYAEWRRLLAEHGTPLRTARPGEQLPLGGGVNLTVLAARSHPEAALLLQITYGQAAVVLAGASDAALEAQLARGQRWPRQALLVFPWTRDPHTALVEQLQPTTLIFTDAATIEPPVLLTYAERGAASRQLYHEKLDGDVTVISDGTRIWVTTQP